MLEVNVPGPTQLYVTPAVDDEPLSVEVRTVQVRLPLALALAPGKLTLWFTTTDAVAEHVFTGLVTVTVYVPAAVTTGF